MRRARVDEVLRVAWLFASSVGCLVVSLARASEIAAVYLIPDRQKFHFISSSHRRAHCAAPHPLSNDGIAHRARTHS